LSLSHSHKLNMAFRLMYFNHKQLNQKDARTTNISYK